MSSSGPFPATGTHASSPSGPFPATGSHHTRACGKTTSSIFTGSIKHEQSLHGNVKWLRLAANGSSHLAYRSPALKNQWNLSVSSSSANVVTTFDDDQVVSSSVHEEKIGVLLLNLGGPETLDDVQPFLFNLFADPDIIRLPRLFRFLQRPLAKLISTFRAPKSKEGYASIGGGSPLRKITDEQASALKIALEKKKLNANIYVGMRYWYPFTEEAIDQIKKDRITKLVVLPLYPQYSISTSGSSIRVLQNIVNYKELGFRGYTLPKHVSSVVPSGFMHIICRLKAHGYPIPPPLVLEFNGQLLNHFEECFGELLPWKGYPYGDPPGGSGERVWKQLPNKVVTEVSRRVVSLASFNGYVRSFACTGLLIKWHGKQNVILTSASLVRSRDNEDNIDNSLTIEVFLPPNQRSSGTLEFYNLEYNIAIFSLKKNFNAIRPDDIFIKSARNTSEKVVAIGRDGKFGILMAASGEVTRGNKGCKLDCKVVRLSTCKIKKAGIGGPLINLDGSFVGMNFYDGSGVTPFLPRHKIAEILRGVNSLPSECGYNHPMHIGRKQGIQKNMWPVPEAYWYHGALDVSDLDLGHHIGRCLN